MKLAYFLLLCLLKTYHTRHVSTDRNGIRIPLTRIPPTMEKLNSAMLESYNATQSDNETKIQLKTKNLRYYGIVSFGIPPAKMKIDFDTGSIDTWVISALCNSSVCLKGDKILYNHTISTTYQELNKKNKNITYGTGWTWGFWSVDVISIDRVQIKTEFIEATKFSEEDENQPCDGLMGLRYHPNVESGHIISRFCQQSNIKGSKFSFYLTKNPFDQKGGELMLCGADKSKYRGELNYIDEISPGKWKIPMKRASINYPDKRTKELSINTKAYVDTGASFIYGPKEYIQAIYSAVNGTKWSPGFRKVECGTIDKLPNITFRMGGEDYVLTGQDYVIKVDKQTCVVGFGENTDKEWILGEVFIRKYYSVFDVLKHRIGFAESIHH